MKISVLVCSKSRRNELENIVEILNNIVTTFNYEIIVVEETEESSPISGTLYISHPIENKGIPYARNLALKYASGDIVVFIDDDCMVDREWLDLLIEPFNDAMVIGVQGGVTVPEHTNAIGWAEIILGFPGGGVKRIVSAGNKTQETQEISTLNCAYRKWVLDKVGGFDESLKLGGEDYLIAKQIAPYGVCLFVSSAVVYHQSRGSLAEIWRWFIRRGRAEIGVIRTKKYKQANYGSLLKASIIVKLAIVLIIGVIFFDLFAFIIPTAFILYWIMQYWRYYRTWQYSKAKKKTFYVIPVVKLIMDLAADLGRLKALIFD